MHKIALPKKTEIIPGEEAGSARIVIEPLFPGYGTTVGNSLRRVLLSSLSGAGVIGVKIKGVSHEFMTLPHLKEDILDFIMNLKQLRLKCHSEEVVKLQLSVHGKKEISAKDINDNSEVEIANPDLVLGHITDMAGSIEAEISVKNGMGYEMVENRDKKYKSDEVGYIEIDSIYSPVLSAGIKVDNVRVGNMTNWDKLILELKTDGTISPEQAFTQSVEILLEQFSALKIQAAETETDEVVEEDEDEDEDLGDDDNKKKRGRPKKGE